MLSVANHLPHSPHYLNVPIYSLRSSYNNWIATRNNDSRTVVFLDHGELETVVIELSCKLFCAGCKGEIQDHDMIFGEKYPAAVPMSTSAGIGIIPTSAGAGIIQPGWICRYCYRIARVFLSDDE
jgi:hypothetical protein